MISLFLAPQTSSELLTASTYWICVQLWYFDTLGSGPIVCWFPDKGRSICAYQWWLPCHKRPQNYYSFNIQGVYVILPYTNDVRNWEIDYFLICWNFTRGHIYVLYNSGHEWYCWNLIFANFIFVDGPDCENCENVMTAKIYSPTVAAVILKDTKHFYQLYLGDTWLLYWLTTGGKNRW